MKSIDFVAASFRRELEEDESWLNPQDDSEGEHYHNSKANNETSNFIPGTKKVMETSEDLMMVKANYNFAAESENEISLRKGDIIKVTKHIDEGWWIGTCNGKNGMFPSNYVSIIEDEKQNPVKDLNAENEPPDSLDESKSSQTVAKPGFSYLPQGTPITFIGRKAVNSKSNEQDEKVEIIASCGQCNCNEFAANVFKIGHCNNCFHKH